MWLHSCITCKTLGEAIEPWVRFWRLVHRDQSSWLIDKPLLLDRLYFTFETSAHPDDYNDMFPARLYFRSAENAIVFSRRFLDMPVVRSADNVPDFVANLPHLMSAQRVDLSLTAQTRRMLQEAENVDELPLSLVSRTLNRSVYTIRRHLKVEGSHFSEIKESVRRDRAVYHLECLKTPINQIA
jgi:hypothetical protein